MALRAADWRQSVLTFAARGLNIDDLQRLIEVAMRSRAVPDETWRYFCGACWRTIGDRDELARRLIENGEV